MVMEGSGENIFLARSEKMKNWYQQMSDFQAEVHQIRFPLSPDPAGGAYSAPADPLAALNIAP